MDLKGVTWVGHVYQKFEAMCLEVEEMMYQDTVNYVENQVQTIGATVKKFYSDVMQDLLPPSSDIVKAPLPPPPSSDTSVENYSTACRMPNTGLKVETTKVDDKKVTKDLVVIADANKEGLYNDRNICHKTNIQKLAATKASGKVTYMQYDFGQVSSLGESRHISDEMKCCQTEKILASHSVESDWPDFVESDWDNSEHPPMAKSFAAEMHKQCAPSIGALTEPNGRFMDASTFYPNVSLNGAGEQNTDEVVLASSSGRSDGGNVEEGECDRVAGQETVAIGRSDIRGVEESCVIVNGNELHILPEVQCKHRTYKKKIRDAISSRIRSTRKKEYKQLAVYNGDKERGQMVNNLESEWELL